MISQTCQTIFLGRMKQLYMLEDLSIVGTRHGATIPMRPLKDSKAGQRSSYGAVGLYRSHVRI